jgi:hypothetical protein
MVANVGDVALGGPPFVTSTNVAAVRVKIRGFFPIA